jgi:hypothetical protein
MNPINQSVLLGACIAFSLVVQATPAGAPVPRISVSPAEAAPGVKRTITIDTLQLQGCEATGARLEVTSQPQGNVLVVQLTGGRPQQILCDIVVNRQYSVEYTPDNEGELPVLAVAPIMGGGGGVIAQSSLVTRSTPTLRSRFDLTGIWYDPVTDGSGLTFVHAAPRNDAVFGTWFLYDATGRPRWYTIQHVTWKSGGMEAEGALLETSAAINVCPLTIVGCPLAAAVVAPAGRARVVMHDNNRARIEAQDNQGRLVFSSILVRVPI